MQLLLQVVEKNQLLEGRDSHGRDGWKVTVFMAMIIVMYGLGRAYETEEEVDVE